MPHKATVSRWRFLLDVAMMQEERDVNAASGPCTRYIMSDSSPQHGRDYLVTVVCAVRHADFEELRVLSSRLLHFWSSSSLGKADLLGCGEDEVGAILRDEAACMERVRSLLRQHTLPLIVLASSRTRLRDKFEAAALQFFLVAGHTAAHLERFSKSILVPTTDMGTELGLSSVAPVRIDELFPWCEDAYLERGGVVGPEGLPLLLPEESEEADLFDVAEEVHHHVDLSNAMPNAGQLHILHNAANGVLKVMPTVDAAIDELKVVADMVRQPHSRGRLLETCFTSNVGKQFHNKLKSFKGKVFRGRWGTVAFCVIEMLAIQQILRWGWSLVAYKAGQKTSKTDTKEDAKKWETIDNAVRSPKFWAAIEVANIVYEIIRKGFVWSEGCRCHTHILLSQKVPPQLEKAMGALPHARPAAPRGKRWRLLGVHLRPLRRGRRSGLHRWCDVHWVVAMRQAPRVF